MPHLRRAEPKLPAYARKTYSILRPDGADWWQTVSATCEEFQCGAYLRGWQTVLPVDDPRADYIRYRSGRKFTEDRTVDGFARFTFERGQRCFSASDHMLRRAVEREPLYVVREGDYRGNPRGTAPRQHSSADSWADDFATNQEAVAARVAQMKG